MLQINCPCKTDGRSEWETSGLRCRKRTRGWKSVSGSNPERERPASRVPNDDAPLQIQGVGGAYGREVVCSLRVIQQGCWPASMGIAHPAVFELADRTPLPS